MPNVYSAAPSGPNTDMRFLDVSATTARSRRSAARSFTVLIGISENCPMTTLRTSPPDWLYTTSWLRTGMVET